MSEPLPHERNSGSPDEQRRRRGAQVSVEVGPCPDCGYSWNANPVANRAKCPRCYENGLAGENADTPTVDVPNREGDQ